MVYAVSYLPEYIPAQLELVGPEAKSDNNLPELRNLSELGLHRGWSRVKRHGIIEQRGTFKILQNVRARLVYYHPEPNHFEALPQKMFEYMRGGLPVIAPDFLFWRKSLGESGFGIFVDPLNPQEISNAIEYVLTHPPEAEETGRRGQAAVLQNLTWDTEAEKLIQFYRAINN
jgi:glycosyltransferase involved in cell wall biosynthesis